MKKWFIYRDEFDSSHYIYTGNGMSCMIFPMIGTPMVEFEPKDTPVLEEINSNNRKKVFTLPTRKNKKYQVVARGEFKED